MNLAKNGQAQNTRPKSPGRMDGRWLCTAGEKPAVKVSGSYCAIQMKPVVTV